MKMAYGTPSNPQGADNATDFSSRQTVPVFGEKNLKLLPEPIPGHVEELLVTALSMYFPIPQAYHVQTSPTPYSLSHKPPVDTPDTGLYLGLQVLLRNIQKTIT